MKSEYKKSLKLFSNRCFDGKVNKCLCYLTRNHSFYRYTLYKCYLKSKVSIVRPFKILYSYLYQRKSLKINVQINCDSILEGFYFHHNNVVINKRSIIGKNLDCFGNNCIGGKNDHAPILGDNIIMGYGSMIIGNVRIANNVVIGAGAIVTKDVLTEGATVVGVNRVL
ncbi:MAG: hypothetical protein IJ186_02185 [Bacilli bacterium]|nr:hypothetical protein [Bacilli bacterium]